MSEKATMGSESPLLFSSLQLRDLRLANRVVISPMCQHAADDGRASDWHLVHLGKFALGGAGLIITESTAVSPHGRIGIRDLGLWSDDQVAPLQRVVDFVHTQGGKIGVQLAHAGRKAACHALWDGGAAFTQQELDTYGWRRFGPSPIAAGAHWTVPETLDRGGMELIKGEFAAAAQRAERAGFDVVELHFGHGYLATNFLSPLSNQRSDEYGGIIENRMRFPLEIVERVREVWPTSRPLFCRISAVDGVDGGWSLDDSVIFAQELGARGVDIVDVSSGGLSEEIRQSNVPRGLGFQVPYAARIRAAGIQTQAVGVIVDGLQAEEILASGKADLIAIGRAALEDPYWPRRAAEQLGLPRDFANWPVRHGAWLAKREKAMGEILDDRRRQLMTEIDVRHEVM